MKRRKVFVEQLETRDCPSSLEIATSIQVYFRDPQNNPAQMVANFMEDPKLATPSFWTGHGTLGGDKGLSFHLAGAPITYDWPGSTNSSGTTTDGWGGNINPTNQALAFTATVDTSKNPNLPVGSTFTIAESWLNGVKQVQAIGTGNDFTDVHPQITIKERPTHFSVTVPINADGFTTLVANFTEFDGSFTGTVTVGGTNGFTGEIRGQAVQPGVPIITPFAEQLNPDLVAVVGVVTSVSPTESLPFKIGDTFGFEVGGNSTPVNAGFFGLSIFSGGNYVINSLGTSNTNAIVLAVNLGALK